MAHLWRGVIREYADRLPMLAGAPVVTLQEGGTPLIPCEGLSELTGANVLVKFEGLNPTGSFKDRGMIVAIAEAMKHGAKAVICASTGNTSASRRGVRRPRPGMTLCRARARRQDRAWASWRRPSSTAPRSSRSRATSTTPRGWPASSREAYPVALVNSVNPYRIEGQKTAAFEIVDALGDAPDLPVLPVGNAGNITAYWRGFVEYDRLERPAAAPQMWGFQAAGAAPHRASVGPWTTPRPSPPPSASATRRRWTQAEAARDESGGGIETVTDDEILEGHRVLSSTEGIFVEPGSAASIAGLLKAHRAGIVPADATIVCTVTGHGLKDPQWALRTSDGEDVAPVRVPVDAFSVAVALGLDG